MSTLRRYPEGLFQRIPAFKDPADRPGKVIFMIADGLSHGAVALSNYFFSQRAGVPLAWAQLLDSPHAAKGFFNSRSLDSVVTDSAAAASAFSSGCRVPNGSINCFNKDEFVLPLFSLLKEGKNAGITGEWATGVITTTTVTHATPAAFVAQQFSRESEPDLAINYLNPPQPLNGLPVQPPFLVMGGGARMFREYRRASGETLEEAYKAAGFQVAKSRGDLNSLAAGKPLLGLFDNSHLAYCIDRENDLQLRSRIPTLREMLEVGLNHLEESGKRNFVLVVEGGRVDHAAHASDAPALIHELIDFDQAVHSALKYQEEFPETLIIVTTDHGNSNPGVSGFPPRSKPAYYSSDAKYANLVNFRGSVKAMLSDLGYPGFDVLQYWHAPSVEKIESVISHYAGYVPPPSTLESFQKMLAVFAEETNAKIDQRQPEKKFPAALYNSQLVSPENLLGIILGEYTGIGWIGSTHTSDFCPVLAIGPQSELFQGFYDNCDLNRRLLEGLGCENLNTPKPTEPLAIPAWPDSAGEKKATMFDLGNLK